LGELPVRIRKSDIVDFVCLASRLIVELDGGQHAETIGYDAVRTNFLKSRGYRVIRFWNNEMLVNREAVFERIYEELSKGKQAPSPRPSPRGERE
jgi:very-short-patch-repair endonuclease